MIAAEDYAAGPWATVFGRFVTVTAEAVLVENRLNIPWKIKHIRDAGDGCYFPKGSLQGRKGVRAHINRRARSLLVAADTTGCLARHDR